MSDSAYQLDNPRDEMICGKIVAMSPRPLVNHNRAAGNIHTIFNSYLKGRKCEAFSDGTDLYLSPANRFVPDGMIVCDKDKIKLNGIYGAPDLVVEVLSYGTAKRDKGPKKAAYEKAGVREYWIVDTISKSIEVHLLKDGVFELDAIYCIIPEDVVETMNDQEKAGIVHTFHCSLFPDLTISLADIFDKLN